MSRKIELLETDFREKAEELINICKEKHGVIMRPFFTVRDAYEQAKLWRQSRPWPQIETALSDMTLEGASWLAGVLESVGPQNGKWATNALPGQSWHQHDEAIDCFVLNQETNGAIWDSKHEGYRVYAKEAVTLGLDAGYYWQRRDAVHVQKEAGRVMDRYSWAELDELMKDRFGKEEERAVKVDTQLKAGYPEVRKEVEKLVNNPKSKFDNLLMQLLDMLFQFRA